MSVNTGPAVQVGSDWEELAARAAGRTLLLVGPPGAGKSTLANFLASALTARGERVARVTGDPGQPSFGPPACVASAPGAGGSPDAMWFVGSTSPAGHLLPAALGVARLVDRARERGARSIIVDASGMVGGPAARVLTAHTCLAARADFAVAVGRHAELSQLAALLARCGARIWRTSSPGARERPAAERRAFRDAMFARHFAGSARRAIDPALIVASDWLPLTVSDRPAVARGSVAGVLDAAGFCRGLGVFLEARNGRAVLDTPVAEASSAARIQIARLRLDPAAGYAEAD